MRQAGRYLPEYRKLRGKAGSFLELCYDPALAAEITLQPVRRFALDAAIVFSDILVIPDALGQAVSFREGEGPVLEPVRSDADIARLDGEGPRERLAPVYETLRQVRVELPGGTALIGFAGAPWTIATYMVEGGTSRDFSVAKGWAFGAPESFGRLISLLEDALCDHLLAQIAAGAEVLQLFDSWAGVLPEGAFERWCVEPIGRIAARIAVEAPGIPLIVFPRLAGIRYTAFAGMAGVAALSLDHSVPSRWAAGELQPRVTVQGNLDPALLVQGGAAMHDAASHILDTLGYGPFVFNLGHGIMQATPPDHVAALCEIVAAWRRQKP